MVLAIAISGVFVGCHEEEFSGSLIEQKKMAFEDAFIRAFGQPDPNHNWGFKTSGATRGITRSGNTGETYLATHYYYGADGQVIASANMNHNQWGSSDLQSMPYGGWIVPDPLTPGQKLRVQKYFQSHPNLSYEDPKFRHFFVQQVYTGGTDAPETGNKEVNVAADGTKKTGASLNQLTVGEANSHINDFNSGTCTASNVLNHEGKTQSDQITLMLNVDDTSCFGYHETSGSNVDVTIQHNDRMALVSAAVIDEWGDAVGIGETVDDKWHRSFMGFDYEMLPESDVIVPNTYAMLSQVQNINNCQYAVYDGTVMKIGQGSTSNVANYDLTNLLVDAYKQNGEALSKDANNIWTWDGQNFTVSSLNIDLTNYKYLVIEFDEAAPHNFNFTYSANPWGGNYNGNSGDTSFSLDLSGMTTLTAFEFQNGSGNGNFKIKSIYLSSGANEVYYDSQYLLAGTEQIPFYSTNTNMYGGEKITLTSNDFYTTVDGKTCLNLDRIKQLYDWGYRPIDTALWNWVKYVPVHDNYYSDWIVTLAEAKRINDVYPGAPDVKTITGEPGKRYTKTGWTIVESGRVMCEDLATSSLDDMDFNDIVYDAIIFKEYKYLCTENGTLLYDNSFTDGYETTYANVRLMAAGGTIPVEMVVGNNNYDVHQELGAPDNVMINTLPNTEKDRLDVKMATVFESASAKTLTDKNTGSEKLYGISSISDIKVNVLYNNESTELNSESANSPATYMFCVDLGLPWARERKNFADPYPDFPQWVQNSKYNQWYLNHRAASLYSNKNLEGLTEPEIPEPTIEFYDNNGAGSTLEKVTTSADPGTMAYPASTESILFDFDADGSAPGFLCPAVITKDGTSYDEEKVTITDTSNISVGNTVRIYGVYINGWYINTNFAGMINSGADDGYIDIIINDSNVAYVQSGIKITGQNFTVTYVTVF